MSGPWDWLRAWWRPQKQPTLTSRKEAQVEEMMQELRLRMNVNKLVKDQAPPTSEHPDTHPLK